MRPRYGRWRRYGGRRSKAGPTAYSGNFPVFQESPELEQLRIRLRDFNHDISSCVAKREFYVRTIATGIWIYFIYLYLANVRSSGDLLQALGSVVICAAILWLSCWKLTDGMVSLLFRFLDLNSSLKEKIAAQLKLSADIETTHRRERDEWDKQIAKMKEVAELEARVLREKAREQALKLDTLNPFEFERMVAEKFERKGYSARLTRKSSDGGIDVWLSQGAKKIAVQCKRYGQNNPVSRPDIQKFIGAMITEGADEGIFVATSYFTDGAKKAAQSSPKRLVLMQREEVFMFLEIPC